MGEEIIICVAFFFQTISIHYLTILAGYLSILVTWTPRYYSFLHLPYLHFITPFSKFNSPWRSW